MVSRSVINFANRHKGIRNTLRKEVEDGHKTGRYNNERCALMIKNIDGHYIEKISSTYLSLAERGVSKEELEKYFDIDFNTVEDWFMKRFGM